MYDFFSCCLRGRYHLFLLLTFNFVITQIIPPKDPAYIFIRRNIKEDHKLIYYTDLNVLSYKLYPLTNSNTILRIAPNLFISNNIPDFRFGGWFSFEWANVSLLVDPVVVNENYGLTALGESYNHLGFSGRFQNAFAKINFPRGAFQIGRSEVKWGQSWRSSVILSGYSPGFDHFEYEWKYKNFKYSFLMGKLHSENNDSLGRFKRFIGGKKLSYISSSNNVMITVGDMILYSGLNRSIEINYLNPIIPTFFSDIEYEIERYPVHGVDNDNAMIFFDGRFNMHPNISLYIELLIDDFQMALANRDSIADAIAYKAGIDGLINEKLEFEVEYTVVKGYTYITRGWYTNWMNSNSPLGFIHGPDCRSIFFMTNYWVTDNLAVMITNEYLEKGELTLNSPYDPYDKVKEPFPTGEVSYHLFSRYAIFWSNPHINIEFGIEADQFNFSIKSTYLKLQYLWTIGINY